MTTFQGFRPLRYLIGCFLMSACANGQQPETTTVYPDFPLEAVEASLDQYHASELTTRRFKPVDIQRLTAALPPAFSVDTAGYSVEDRPVFRIAWGEGPTEVLLWSQMHGDEPTATAALYDLFNWLEGSGDGLDSLRTLLASELHLTFLPMLNPDGAERYQRRNALGIDLNRDALHLTSPEANILKDERDRLEADWGFNLHDQSVYYSAGFPGEKGCVISILAPAFDWEKSMSPKREDAAQLIALMNDLWQDYVPGQIGRYNDDFEPRAFGDNLQKWGTRTILIESGGYAGDPEKQQIRRLNVLGLIDGLHAIASGRFEDYDVEDYLDIPRNESNGMHEVILENARVERAGEAYVMDIGFRLNERTVGSEGRQYTASAAISDLGDLSTFGAFERIDLEGMRVVTGKVYPAQMSMAEIRKLDARELYRQGYTAVVTGGPAPSPTAAEGLRVLPAKGRLQEVIDVGNALDLLIFGDDGRLSMAVVNGKVIRLD